MKFRCLLVYMLLPVCCHAQFTWHALSTAPITLRFDDFYFKDPDTGWLINPNYSFYTAAPQKARVFRTYDGGNTWQKLVDNSDTYFRSIGFADAQTGWIGNLADTELVFTTRPTSDTVPLYQTQDGGLSWTPVSLPQPHPLGICGISVVTDSVVYAYGRYSGPAGYVKTMDKGSSWAFVSLDSLAFGLIDGHFFNKDTGFITAMGVDRKAMILSTNNGGASWQICYHSTRSDSGRVWKIYFPSRSIGYGSVQYGGSKFTSYNNYFVKTTDGGLHWIEYPFLANYNEEGIGFINDSVGWLGGDDTRGTYITTDGGVTWRDDATFGSLTPPYTTGVSGFRINRFRSFGDTLMYASGNTIYKLRAGATGLPVTVAAVSSVSNYPNPFSEETTIEYSLTNMVSDVILQIQDASGRTVFQKNLGSYGIGMHSYRFSGKLPVGSYSFSVYGDGYKRSNKMVVVH